MNDIEYAYYTFLLINKILRNNALASFWPGKISATQNSALRLKGLLTCDVRHELLALNSALPKRQDKLPYKLSKLFLKSSNSLWGDYHKTTHY